MRVAWQRCLLAATLALPFDSVAQIPDSVLGQIARRTANGDQAGARQLADSLLAVIPPSSMQFAEVLYWRAITATNAADAERDYRRLSVEYPLSPRSAHALLNLAQLEYSRRDRSAARRHFDQLLREHPEGPLVARASYWSARLSFDDGDAIHGCTALATARARAAAEDIELLNQIEYYAARCMAMPSDSAQRSLPDTNAGATMDSTRRATVPKREFSVQIASFTRKRDAATLAGQLKRRGLDSRVMGTSAPFRVRVGRYVTREAAEAALAKLKRGNPRAIIVEAEPR